MGFLLDMLLPDDRDFNPKNYRRPADIFTIFQREERSKTINLLVRRDLVKVRLIATRDGREEIASISCLVIEINGVPVPETEQQEKVEMIVLNEAPSPQQQRILLLDVLEKFGIIGNPDVVTDTYADGYLRVLRLRQRAEGSR